jgi:hypothetical protein
METTMPKSPFPANAEGMTKIALEDLEEPIRNVQHMASILTTLLEECIVHEGARGTVRIDRGEAEDIIFAAHQLETLAKVVRDHWEAI